MPLLRRLLPLLALLLLAAPAAAQVGATTDILTGIVRDEAGAPIPNAAIEVVSLETRVSRFGRTDARGRYTVLFPDGGGQYRLIVRSLGKEPREQVVTRRGEEDRLEVNVVLVQSAQQLDEVQVQGGGRTPPQRFELPTPGSVERVVSSDQVARLPLDASDLGVLALLAPGVVAVPASDTSAAGFSVAGQRPGGNVITLDGTTFGAAGIPQDAVRATRVITSTYDAARGQFSGGQVASTTRSGTNVLQGTVNYGLRDDQLALQGGAADPFQSGYRQHQLSGGLGGPLVPNRLFFFGSFQARVRDDDLQSLLAASPATLTRLGASPDSVARFEQIVGGFGVPVASFNRPVRDTDAFSGLARLDWLVTDAHTLTLRGDWRDNVTDPSRVSPLALPQTGGEQESRGGGGQLTLTSRFGTALINEAKGYYSVSDGASAPFVTAPQGRVQVISQLEDGSQGVSSLLFGGNPGLPQSSNSRTLELSNEVSWLSPQNGHRPKLGVLYNRTTTTQGSATNRYGTFTYNSLADLEAGRPATFTRTLVPTEREGDAMNGALYAADTWRVSPAWQLTFGGRVEYSRAAGSQAYSPAIDSLFGRRTDALPEELHLSPRLGFTWSLGGGGNSLFNVGGNAFNGGTTIRGGIGEFRSTISPQLLAAAQGPVGSNPTEVQLACVGAGVPVPAWGSYYDDPSTIPTSCLGAGGPAFGNRSPTLTLFNPDFGAPRSWRASLGVTRRVGLGSLNADLSWSRGVRQTGASDLNLDPTTRFTLASEGGRPVFVPMGGIVPQTGAVDFLQSRQSPRFGQVISLDADLVSESWQLTLGAGGLTNGGILYQASYTLARTRDLSSFGGGFGGGTTAGNPNLREWGASDLDRRHTVVLSGTLPIRKQFELTTIARIASGAPYTPRVGSDINGDGARNDRAFLFAPSSAPDTTLGNGMRRLLEGASGGARSCLESQLGRIARRNSCRGPWEPALDLQLNWRPEFMGLKQKLMVSLLTVNLLNGVDRLFHGADDLRGWGQVVRPDATLLYVTGFDPAARRFRYAVNERFGSVRNSATAVVAPFQVGIQLRYTIGPDRQREMIQMVRGGAMRGAMGGPGAGAGPGAGPGGGNFFSRFATLIPNPARQVLEFRLGLNLDDTQAAKLTALADSIDARNKELAAQVEAEIAKAGSSPDPARLFSVIRPFLERGQAGTQADLKAVEAVLTPEQWRQVPERVKTPGFRFGGGPGGPPGGARPPL